MARDLRTQLVAKLATQDLAYIQQITPARLLTNLTSDVDAVKLFVSQAIASLVSSVFLIIGASVLLLVDQLEARARRPRGAADHRR